MRARICQILEPSRSDDQVSRWVDVFIITLILLNIIAIILESVNFIHDRYWQYFLFFESFSVAVFSIEYFLRIWSIVDRENGKYSGSLKGRLRFALTPMALVDFLAIAPYFLAVFFSLDLRFLRALRLLRVFKLTRYSPGMTILLRALREELHAFGAAFFILLVILVLASSGIYLFEQQAQPHVFGSIPKSLWWAVSTLSTVGYGDVTPVTVGGKIFGAAVMVVGIGMVALPAGILASAFSEQMRIRREEYEDIAEEALLDGVVTQQEKQDLASLRARLGLSEKSAGKIFSRIAKDDMHMKATCPHCHKKLYKAPLDDSQGNSDV